MAKQKTFEDLMQDLFGDSYETVFVDKDYGYNVFSTKSPSLDISLGIGGIPTRRFTEIFGPESSGKSTLSYMVAKSAMEAGRKVLYIDVENQAPLDYIGVLIAPYKVGVDFIVAKPNTSDDTFEICEGAIQSKEFGVIILDSVGALAPIEEKKDPFTKQTMMVTPKDMAHFLKRNAYAIRETDVAFIFINQVRDKVGSYVKGYETPGGHALKHFLSIRIALTKGEDIKVNNLVTGINSRFTTVKNKLASPKRSFIIPIIFGKGVDTYRDLVSFAETLGVITKAGAYYRFEGENLGQGMVKTLEALESNPEMLDKIMGLCYNSLAKVSTQQDDDEESEE